MLTPNIALPMVLPNGTVCRYNNGYGQEFEAWHIPPGWEEWLGMRTQGYYNWSASDQVDAYSPLILMLERPVQYVQLRHPALL